MNITTQKTLPIITYDMETFKNCFLFGAKFYGDNRKYVFEISEFKDERVQLIQFINWLSNLRPQQPICKTIKGVLMNGFKSLDFDYPILHHIINNPHSISFTALYNLAQEIITADNFKGQQRPQIWQSDRHIDQFDLFKMHHFDNKAKMTNLKNIEFVLRSPKVSDLPYDPHTPLTQAEIVELRSYLGDDLDNTELFLTESLPQLQLRLDFLDEKIVYGDVLNFNDTKIGKEYVAQGLGKAVTHERGKKKQTFRSSVRFEEILLPDLRFATEECQSVLDWYKTITVYPSNKKDKDDKKKLQKTISFYGNEYVFGLGGAHGSVDRKYFESNEDYVIVDVDVTSYYPSHAIKNALAPEHLGKPFVEFYKELRTRRLQYPKESAMNKVLKLALNGIFGDSNNIYSLFYDPKFLYSITINCQMLILKLVEDLCTIIPECKIIQANTDGVTVYIPRWAMEWLEMVKTAWCNKTGLQLEQVIYSRMWVRDVNNYLAVSDKGKIKRKGAYWYPETKADLEGNWHKDMSCLVVQKAVERVLIDGFSPEFAVAMFTDPFDYMLRHKTTGSSQVFIGQEKMLRTTRYYVSTSGERMRKFTPIKPEQVGHYKRKNKLTDKYYEAILAEIGIGVWDERIHTGKKDDPKTQKKYQDDWEDIEKGYLIKECNDAQKFNAKDINYEYYVEKVKDLIIR